MKYFYFNTFLLLFSLVARAGDIDRYMQGYAQTKKSDFKQELEIIAKTRLKKLIGELAPFYGDSMPYVRQKAYYLTYKKGLHEKTNGPGQAIHKLLDGCHDPDKGIVGQNIGYLQQFSIENFDRQAIEAITALVGNKRAPHYKGLVLLAGFTGAGKEGLYQRFLDQETPPETKLYIAFALSRMGVQEATGYCLETLRAQKVSDGLVDYLIPLAIYSRQKEAFKFCEGIIFMDKKLCHSPNPDYSGKILCGYRVLELMAPVIEGFPIKVDETGSISGKSYEGALMEARQWFKDSPGYKLKTDVF